MARPRPQQRESGESRVVRLVVEVLSAIGHRPSASRLALDEISKYESIAREVDHIPVASADG